MTNALNILVVDDEPSMLRYTQDLLEVDLHSVRTATSGAEAISKISSGPVPDLVLLDLAMPELDGLQTLALLRQRKPDLNVVMLSCITDTAEVVKAMQLGARNYITKPFKKFDLDSTLATLVDEKLRFGVRQASSTNVEELGEDTFFLAASPAMQQLRVQANLIANVDVPVLILGESGTGKEVVARLIHKLSARAHRPMHKVNCAAMPHDLLESELFGYEVGAFTGATRPKPGKFELANKGTMLLDEIGEMTPSLQAKLLQVLQDQEFSKLGSRASMKVDVRIMAATNIDIQKSIAAKQFREDLYYRLNAFTLTVPPLRERTEEIPLLLRQMTSRYSERFGRTAPPLSAALLDACVAYAWPGNVRELENFVKRFIILDDEKIAIAEIQSGRRSAHLPQPALPAPENDLKRIVRSIKDEAEIAAISRTLEQTGWNRKEAALLLNISYKALLYKIRQYGIDPGRARQSNRMTANA